MSTLPLLSQCPPPRPKTTTVVFIIRHDNITVARRLGVEKWIAEETTPPKSHFLKLKNIKDEDKWCNKWCVLPGPRSVPVRCREIVDAVI